MSKRVLWLFFWTTLAFWAGCSQTQQARTEDVDAAAAAYRRQVKGEGSTASAKATAAEEAAPGAPAEPGALELGVSVIGLERDNWKPVAIAPVSGAVPHHPQYFRTGGYRLVHDRPNPLASASIEQQADAVTAGARAPFDARDLAGVPLGAAKGAFDLAAIPVKVVFTPPWTIHYSPSTAP